MKKNFKNSFGVKGSPAQIEAFKEYAESIGWTYQDDPGGADLYFQRYNVDDEQLQPNHFWYSDATENVFSLPSQWNEAMQAASEEVEEPKPEFERGEKVRSVDSGLVIVCSGETALGVFSGTVISTNGFVPVGEYRSTWHKDCFTLHTSPVTL